MSARAGWILLASLCTGACHAEAAGEATPRYEVLYDVRLLPTQRAARVAIRLGQEDGELRWLRLRIDPERHRDFQGDGTLETEGNTVLWTPPPQGGRLRYTFRINHLRDSRSYDARCAEDWAIFRGDDLVPPARTRFRAGAESRARLRFRLPERWSVATPYPRARGGDFRVDHPDRRFDRPTGWIVAGRLGVIRERVAETRVAIAGPVGHSLRRLDQLALLRWALPALREIAGSLPDRLLVVGAGDPMWRGGLSGPNSVFLHASRPLITDDGTSPLLHEIVHVLMRGRAEPGADWIVEGLAEYYALEALARSRTLSRRRYEKSLKRLEAKGKAVRRLGAGDADAAVTARAVLELRELDRRIREATDEARDLDDVLRELVAAGEPISLDGFRAVVTRVAGAPLDGFFERPLLSSGSAPAAAHRADADGE